MTMNNPPTFAEMKGDLTWDGSLRDIYVLDTHFSDWDRLSAMIASSDFAWSYVCDGEPSHLPLTFEKYFADQSRGASMLTVRLTDGLEVVCHFFCMDEIEFSFNPALVLGQHELDQLFKFVRELGEALSKRVLVAPENAPAAPLLIFDPTHPRWERRNIRGKQSRY